MVTVSTGQKSGSITNSHAYIKQCHVSHINNIIHMLALSYLCFSKLFNDSRRIFRRGGLAPQVPGNRLTLSDGLSCKSVLTSARKKWGCLQLKQLFQSCSHVHADSCAYCKLINSFKAKASVKIQTSASSEKTITVQ